MSNKQRAPNCSLDSKSKRKQIREKLRQQQVEDVLRRLRCLQSMQNEDEKLPKEIESSFLGMNESGVLDAISHYLQNEIICFEFQSIELFTKITPSFCPQFCGRVVALIVSNRKLRTDTSFLNLALLVANKCQKIFITKYTNLQKCIHGFIAQMRGQFHSTQRLVQLLCVILIKEENKRDVLQAIHENWKSLRELGLLNNCYLKLAALCCHQGPGFVCEIEIKYYLDCQKILQKDEAVDFTDQQIYLLCRVVCAFFRQNKAINLRDKFFNWMSTLHNLNLIGCRDKEEMLATILCMFQHLQLFEKQELACLIVGESEFISFLLEFFSDSQSGLRHLSMQIIYCIISFSSEQSFKQLNLNFGVISKTVLSLSPDLQNRQNMAILKCAAEMLTKYSCLFTEQERSTLEQKLVVLSNSKALQNEAYRLLTQLDYLFF